jgi:2'-hydroxyisoflavone reductase
MRLLILGGTVFLGRHLAEAALAAGHTITLFNRGQTNPSLFPEIEQLRGDRTTDLSGLRGRRWDAVVDTSGYLPRVVRASAELLAESADHYTFISSISVYDNPPPGADESAPVGRIEDEATEVIDGRTYGPLKALCEQAAEAAMPGRTASIRAGLIVGPHDRSDRFTFWPARVARGGDVLAAAPDRPVQLIDVRDLAAWVLHVAETGKTGAYNATGPARRLTAGEFLDGCREALGSDARFLWVSDPFLEQQGIRFWSDLPVLLPADGVGYSTVNCARAIGAGLRFRPLAETVRDTLAWDRHRPAGPARAGLDPEREQQALAAWRQQNTGA